MIDGGLRGVFRMRLPTFQWSAIETGMTISGVPDDEFCSAGRQGWLEYKATESYGIRNTPLTRFQIAWHERRAREGGRSFVAVRRRHDGGPRKGGAADELWLFSGSDIRPLYTGGLRSAPCLATFGGGPGRWDWARVALILLGPRG